MSRRDLNRKRERKRVRRTRAARLREFSHVMIKLSERAREANRAQSWYAEPPNWSDVLMDALVIATGGSARRVQSFAADVELDLTDVYFQARWCDATRYKLGPWPSNYQKIRAAFESAFLAGDQITAYEIVAEWVKRG